MELWRLAAGARQWRAFLYLSHPTPSEAAKPPKPTPFRVHSSKLSYSKAGAKAGQSQGSRVWGNQGKLEQGRGQGREGQVGTGQGIAGKLEQGRAGQGKAGQGRAGQGGAGAERGTRPEAGWFALRHRGRGA